MLWEPWKVAVLGIAAWLAVRLLSPIEAHYSLDWTAITYIGGCYLALLIGCFSANLLSPIRGQGFRWEGQLNRTLYFVCVAMGLVGFVAKVVDRVYLRGVDYFGGADAVRQALMNSQATPLGALGAALIPLCYLPLILLLSSKPGARYAQYMGLSIAMFALPAIESLGQLSRVIILVSLFLGVATVSLLRFNGRLLVPKLLIPGVVIFIGSAVLSTAMLETRINDFNPNFSLTDSIYESAYSETVSPTAYARERIFAGGALERNVYSTVVTNSLYYTSGIYEFSRLMTRPDEQKFAYGTYLFQPYTKLVATLLNIDNAVGLQEEVLFPRLGVFNSFFGPWWIDFGWAGIFVMFGLGYGVTKLAHLARRGYLNIVPIYLYMLLILFYMPVVNLMVLGNGFFALHGLGLFALFTSFGRGPEEERAAPQPPPEHSA